MTYPSVAVNCVIWKESDSVLLTRRADNGLWCLPGGMLEVGETISSAMQRELSEEIDCDIRVGALVGVYSAPNLRLTPPAVTFLIVVVANAIITRGVPSTSKEVTAAKYFHMHSLPELVANHRERIFHSHDVGHAGARVL
jgi:ADP-ribose pyrophosphatase YjhB (NUDIX family)